MSPPKACSTLLYKIAFRSFLNGSLFCKALHEFSVYISSVFSQKSNANVLRFHRFQNVIQRVTCAITDFPHHAGNAVLLCLSKR